MKASLFKAVQLKGPISVRWPHYRDQAQFKIDPLTQQLQHPESTQIGLKINLKLHYFHEKWIKARSKVHEKVHEIILDL